MRQLFSVFSAIATALQNMEEGLVIADPRQPDAPIVYANDGFLRLTGYSYEETIGKNCRFLQYEKTDKAELDRLRTAIARGEKVTVELWNRKKDGNEFLNRLSLVPVYENEAHSTPEDTSTPDYYIGIQSDITDLRLAQERAARIDTLKITMRTVNDIVMNAFNGLQSFRDSIAQSLDSEEDIEFFDTLIREAVEKLRKIEALQELDKDSSRGIDILKYD